MGGKLETNDLSVGFIGGGRITQLLLEAWKNQGELPAKVLVSDSSAEVLQSLRKKFAHIETVFADNSKLSSCDFVFLALHPPAIAAVLDEMKGKLKSSAFLYLLRRKSPSIKCHRH